VVTTSASPVTSNDPKTGLTAAGTIAPTTAAAAAGDSLIKLKNTAS